MLILAAQVAPGRAEAWRRVCQELLGSRAGRFDESSRRLGVRSQRVWVVPSAPGDLVVVRLDVAAPERALGGLAESEAPFDAWLRRQVRQLTGLDLAALAQVGAGEVGDLVLEWDRRGDDEHGRGAAGGGDGPDDRG